MRENIRKTVIQIIVVFAVVCASVLPAAAHTGKTVSASCTYMSRRPQRFAAYVGDMSSSVPVSDKLMKRVRKAVMAHAPYADISDLNIYIPSDQIDSFTTDISTAIAPRCPDIICLDPGNTVYIDTNYISSETQKFHLLKVYVSYVIRKKNR